jgi:hypothetical protein
MAIPFDGSLPIVTSPSDRGIVESFKGPESTTSLGRKLLTSRPSYHTSALSSCLNASCSIIRTDRGRYPIR